MATEINELRAIQTAYHNLITKYTELLRIVASGRSNWVTRQTIEDHIRVNLLEIVEAFTLIEYNLLDSDNNNDLTWLRQQTDYLTRLAGQLANIRRQVIAYLWRGLALIFTSAVLEYAGPDAQPEDVKFLLNNYSGIAQTLFGVFGILLVLFSVFFAGASALAMTSKRSYLNPGYDINGEKIEEGAEPKEGVSIYKLENELFRSLLRKKPPEPLWDVLGLAMVGVFSAVVVLFFFYWFASIAPDQNVGTILRVVGILFVVYFIYIFGNVIRRRLQRER